MRRGRMGRKDVLYRRLLMASKNIHRPEGALEPKMPCTPSQARVTNRDFITCTGSSYQSLEKPIHSEPLQLPECLQWQNASKCRAATFAFLEDEG